MQTTLGSFSVNLTADGSGGITALTFETPEGTTGDVVLPVDTNGSLESGSGQIIELESGTALGLAGGSWTWSS